MRFIECGLISSTVFRWSPEPLALLVQRRLRTRCVTSECMCYWNVFLTLSNSFHRAVSDEKRKRPRGIPTYQTPVRPTKRISLREIAKRSWPKNIFSSRLQITNTISSQKTLSERLNSSGSIKNPLVYPL